MTKSNYRNKSVFDFAGRYKIFTIIGCTLSGISAILALVPFICIWNIVKIFFYGDKNGEIINSVNRIAWMAILFAIGSIVIYFLALMCTHIAAFRTARNMRSEALHHIVKLPLGYFNKVGSGKLRRIIDESSGQTESFLAHQLPDLTGAIVTPISSIIIMFSIDWRLGVVSFIPVILGFICMTGMVGKSMNEGMEKYQNALEDMNNEAVEYIRGIPVVKTFGQTIFSFRNFHEAILRYKKWVIGYTISCRKPMVGFTTAINSIFIFLIPTGILLLGRSINSKDFLLDFIFYILFTPICVVMMSRILYAAENAIMAKDASGRINLILSESQLAKPNITKSPKNQTITFKNVSFSYPGNKNKAVDGVSFEVKKGETIALVGPSGGGKTTIASLIPRFFDVTEGAVKIGDVDVRKIENKNLMDHVSFIFQNTRLFKASIIDNVKVAKPDATNDEVLKALRLANCDDIIDKMPNGINTIIGGNGVYLSGGEMQRIALARAILKDAPIIVLDEATAFTDPENEYQIQNAITQLTKNKTVVMIAHRLSTIKNADNILVIDKGKIKEQGRHKDLLEKRGIYFNMWNEYQTSISWKIGRVVC